MWCQLLLFVTPYVCIQTCCMQTYDYSYILQIKMGTLFSKKEQKSRITEQEFKYLIIKKKDYLMNRISFSRSDIQKYSAFTTRGSRKVE